MRNARKQIWTLVLAAVIAALFASPASSKTCAQRVIDDWVDNTTIDRVYPLHCYREAIAALPEDAATYSSASDDIRRALQEQVRAQEGGSTDGSTTTDGSGAAAGSTDGGPGSGASGTSPGEGEGAASGSGDAGTGGEAPGSGGAAPSGEGSAAAPSDEAFGVDLGDGGGSLPLPVIVFIAALGVAAAAAAGTIMIRRLPRSGGPPSAPSGPAGS